MPLHKYLVFHSLPIEFNLFLENLVLGKALGPDSLTTYTFKHCTSEIAPILQMLFMQSLNTGTFPEDWLTVNTTPVYREGSRNIPSNYRPISLTSVCSKLMEHIVFHSIMHAACTTLWHIK